MKIREYLFAPVIRINPRWEGVYIDMVVLSTRRDFLSKGQKGQVSTGCCPKLNLVLVNSEGRGLGEFQATIPLCSE